MDQLFLVSFLEGDVRGIFNHWVFMKIVWEDEVELFSRFAVSRPQIGSKTSFSCKERGG